VIPSSGNVFADMNLPDAIELDTKARLPHQKSRGSFQIGDLQNHQGVGDEFPASFSLRRLIDGQQE